MIVGALRCDNPDCPSYFVPEIRIDSLDRDHLRLEAERAEWSSALVPGGGKYSKVLVDFCPGCTDRIAHSALGRHLIKEWISNGKARL